MNFDNIFDLTPGVYIYFFTIIFLRMPFPDLSDVCSRTSLSLRFDIHTPVRSSTGILARLEAPVDVPIRLLLLSSLYSASHSAQPVFALVVGVHVAAVKIFAGNRRLHFAARGVRHAKVLVFVVLLS